MWSVPDQSQHIQGSYLDVKSLQATFEWVKRRSPVERFWKTVKSCHTSNCFIVLISLTRVSCVPHSPAITKVIYVPRRTFLSVTPISSICETHTVPSLPAFSYCGCGPCLCSLFALRSPRQPRWSLRGVTVRAWQAVGFTIMLLLIGW